MVILSLHKLHTRITYDLSRISTYHEPTQAKYFCSFEIPLESSAIICNRGFRNGAFWLMNTVFILEISGQDYFCHIFQRQRLLKLATNTAGSLLELYQFAGFCWKTMDMVMASRYGAQDCDEQMPRAFNFGLYTVYIFACECPNLIAHLFSSLDRKLAVCLRPNV